MKFTIKSITKCSGRVGVLSNSKKQSLAELQTPLLLIYTKVILINYLMVIGSRCDFVKN